MVIGNEAFSRVRTAGLCGDRRSRPRSSRSGSPDGMVAGAGAKNMVFSTFACATAAKSGSKSPRVDSSLICMLTGDLMYNSRRLEWSR